MLSRDAHDTFFISEPSETSIFEEQYLERVREVHSRGGHGSQVGAPPDHLATWHLTPPTWYYCPPAPGLRVHLEEGGGRQEPAEDPHHCCVRQVGPPALRPDHLASSHLIT